MSPTASAQVVLNEFSAASSDRALQWSAAGVPRVGAGTAWNETAYDDAAWQTGAGPFGYGVAASVGTNLQAAMSLRTPSVYLRKKFTVTAAQAALTSQLQLLIDYDSGFVAYINGKEIARRNLGGTNAPHWHDQHADNERISGTTETITTQAANTLLVAGENTLAIFAANNNNTPSDTLLRWTTDPINVDPTFFLKADLQISSPFTSLVTNSQTWSYFPGYVEPSGTFYDPGLITKVTPAGGEDGDGGGPDAELDWVELRNTSASPVNLTGWALTDAANNLRQWIFPAGTTIAAGGFLVVACDELNIAAGTNGAVYHHTNFKLSGGGDYLALVNPFGVIVDQIAPSFPKQSFFHSYGRNASSQWVYLDTPTPGRANAGAELTGIVATPAVNIAGGFYSTAQTVSVTTATAGAQIRYTTDGTEPTSTTGFVWSAPINISSNAPYRFRAFKSGMIPSATVTHTYIIGENSARRSVQAYCLTGDQGRSLYQPHGIMAIVGGSYVSSNWTSGGNNSAYNNIIPRGRHTERPASMEILADASPTILRTDIGLRISGSTYQRPRHVLSNQNSATPNSASPWTWNSNINKPSFNIYLRDEYGASKLEPLIFPNSLVTGLDSLRLRSGKNDNTNPWIRDEWFRRAFREMGHASAVGTVNSLYVNGVFKGFFNATERLRKDFFQKYLNTSNGIDIRQMAGATLNNPPEIDSGDTVHFDETYQFIQSADFNTLAAWQGLQQRMDMENACDYMLINIFAGINDWGTNNLINFRERAPWGRQRFTIWDAEMSVQTTRDKVNIITTMLEDPSAYSLGSPVAILYTRAKINPEFKLLFADRVHRHMSNGGVLTETRMVSSWNTLASQFQPILRDVSNSPSATVSALLPDWVNGKGDTTRYTGSTNRPTRRRMLLDGFFDDTAGGVFTTGQIRAAGLWPVTLPPVFSQFGGTVATNYSLTISNPTSGTIYYTTDGRDPRVAGGAIQGTAYTGAISITRPTLVKARVYNASASDGLVWSPMTEAVFTPPTGIASLAFTEIHYHPAVVAPEVEEDYEFIELMNTGAQTVALGGFKFSAGIDYTFPGGTTLAAGARLVLARNAAKFATRYPGVAVTGEFPSSQLSNDGELLELRDVSNNIVASATWSDTAPWPENADGNGFSLVRINTAASGSDPANWRSSTAIGGSPGVADPSPVTTPIYINEVLGNSGPNAQDFIELFNPNASAINIGDWFLTDDPAQPAKYRIPSGTTIPAGGYLVFTESQFAAAGLPSPFALKSDGDDAWIFSANAAGTLTGWSNGYQYRAQAEGVSSGRYINSVGAALFVPQRANTPGAANAGPLIGPVVITEIMYRPAGNGVEFVEIRNRSAQPQPLFLADTPYTWTIDGIAWQFPANITLTPGQYAVLCGGDPAAFRTANNIPAAIPVLGPFSGSLSNTGEWVTIQRPGNPYIDPIISGTVVPKLDVDRVQYSELAPWPTTPNGTGPSLERLADSLFPNDPANWRASTIPGGTPGRPAPMTLTEWTSAWLASAPVDQRTATADPDNDRIPNAIEYATGSDPLTASPSPLTTIRNGANTTFTWPRSLALSGGTLVLETATSLTGNWTTVATAPTITTAADGTEICTVTVPAAAPQFFRLKASIP